MATEASQGEHHVYRIIPTGSGATGKLAANKHYVGIDAVAWFINKKGNWFTDRISSGTLDIKLADGLQLLLPFYKGVPLDDGAWLLLRVLRRPLKIRRRDETTAMPARFRDESLCRRFRPRTGL